MPACGATALLVRTSRKIQSACGAMLVQIFWPLTMKSSPSAVASVRNRARSEPAPGSEYPWHQMSCPSAILGKKRGEVMPEVTLSAFGLLIDANLNLPEGSQLTQDHIGQIERVVREDIEKALIRLEPHEARQ